MRAVQVSSCDVDTPLQPIDIPTPQVPDDMLLVKVKAAGVNFADLLQKQGAYPRVIPTPYIPGYEMAGEVAAVGRNVSGFASGDRVMGLSPTGGGYAEYGLLHSRAAIVIPRQLEFAEATALLTQGLTAFIMVDRYVRSGNTVLVTAAAGGVGVIALQLAIANGASTVYGAVGGTQKVKSVEAFGGVGVDYRESNWALKLKEQGVQLDIILDSVGGRVLSDAWTLLRDFGSVVNYGVAAGEGVSLPAQDISGLHFKNHALHFYGFSRHLEADPGLYRRGLQALIEHRLSGRLKLDVYAPYSLEQAQQALNDIRDRKTHGKVVLVP